MSMMIDLRKCRACGIYYDYNPSVGAILCPNCKGMGLLGKKLFGRKGSLMSDDDDSTDSNTSEFTDKES